MNFHKTIFFLLFFSPFTYAMDSQNVSQQVGARQNGQTLSQRLESLNNMHTHDASVLNWQAAQEQVSLNMFYENQKQQLFSSEAASKFKYATFLFKQKDFVNAKKQTQEGFALLANVSPAMKQQWLNYFGSSKEGWTLIYDLCLQANHMDLIRGAGAGTYRVGLNSVEENQDSEKVDTLKDIATSTSFTLEPLVPSSLDSGVKIAPILKQSFADAVKVGISSRRSTKNLSKKPAVAPQRNVASSAKQLNNKKTSVPAKTAKKTPAAQPKRLVAKVIIEQKDEKVVPTLAQFLVSEKKQCEYLYKSYEAGRQDFKTMHKLAFLYLDKKSGLKAKVAKKRGLALLRKCAETSFDCRLDLACILVAGETSAGLVVKKNLDEARKIVWNAEFNATHKALYLRAIILMKTEDLKKRENVVKALSLCQCAIDNGSKDARSVLDSMQKRIDWFAAGDALVERVDSLQLYQKGVEAPINELRDLFKLGIQGGHVGVCEAITAKCFSLNIANQIITGAQLLEVDTTVDKKYSLDFIAKIITNVRERIAHEKTSSKNRLQRNEKYQLVCDKFDTSIYLKTLSNHVIPLVEKSNSPLVDHVKFLWLHTNLLLDQKETQNQKTILKQADSFADKLLNRSKTKLRELAGILWLTLGSVYAETGNKYKALENFKKSWDKTRCYEAGSQYAQILLKQVESFSIKASKSEKNKKLFERRVDKLWEKAISIFKECADPEKGNNANLQGLLAGHYFSGAKVGCKSLGKDLDKSEKYARLAANQGDRYGRRILGCVLHQKGKNVEALRQLKLAMQEHPDQWNLLPIATSIQKSLEPENNTITLCDAFVLGFKAAKVSFLANFKTNVVEIIRTAELNDNGTLKECLAEIVLRSVVKTLKEVMARPGVVGQKLYSFVFASKKLTYFQKQKKSQEIALKQLEKIAKEMKARGIKLSEDISS